MKAAINALGAGLLAATAFLAPPAAPAQAQRVTRVNGAMLVQLCSSRDRTAQRECSAYLDGVGDAIDFYQDLVPPDGRRNGMRLPAYVCIPNSATGVDLRATVVNWIRNHPESNDRTAQYIVPRAFHDAFPCR